LSAGANRQIAALLIAGQHESRYDKFPVRNNEMSSFLILGFNTAINLRELTLVMLVAINKQGRQSVTAKRQAGANTGIVGVYGTVHCEVRIADWELGWYV
jgi:hypothetical protein